MEVEAVEEGTVAKLLVEAGSEGVKVNAPIAILLEEDEDASALDNYSSSAPLAGGSPSVGGDGGEPQSQTKTGGDTPSSPPSPANAGASPRERVEGSERIKASPLAKRLAKDAGIDLSTVTGSGPNGRIVKADIDGYSAPKAAPAPAAASQPAPVQSTEVGMPLR